ncbi:hypothetical protein RINGS_68 [Arthrobacter phage Rings]|uniref:Uncharacterized protein n=6 Tax=Amigovirus amigo TaxID=1982100 RepID=A0A0U4INU9_9CAUD|nr:hypothetical protein FDH66_gp37 [Arthrobacter phage Amigo]ALY08510.1 hypothetical protein ANANSI_67 [Arthrobacter phage Anansi]ALY09124.1 hypothetical protein GORGEOUS_67 [Arthrobacter phage Gorgeous]ALY10143.1 hypothetical protein RINGS_68 [Arthrobacter phage Rings]ALY10405.1 hypothetical protein SORJUANA_67 [Arthrobacter phage SorJuana]QJD51713.1 hypothetical protein SEA_BOERSMA_70 [Arthrobacter phage Boersma]
MGNVVVTRQERTKEKHMAEHVEITDLRDDEEFEAAVERAYRADLRAKRAAEEAEEAREDVRQMIIEREGKNYDGGTARFKVTLFPTRRFSAALVQKKLDPMALEAVSSMQVDKKLVEIHFDKEHIQREFSTESKPTLKISLP